MNLALNILVLILISCKPLSLKKNTKFLNTKRGISKTYEYMISKKIINRNIRVCDTLRLFNLSDFSYAICDSKDKIDKISDSLYKISPKSYIENYNVNNLLAQKMKAKSDKNLIFSKMHKNLIVCEIFNLKNQDRIREFNIRNYTGYSKKYLFIFDKKNQIKNYYEIKWRYE